MITLAITLGTQFRRYYGICPRILEIAELYFQPYLKVITQKTKQEKCYTLLLAETWSQMPIESSGELYNFFVEKCFI